MKKQTNKIIIVTFLSLLLILIIFLTFYIASPSLTPDYDTKTTVNCLVEIKAGLFKDTISYYDCKMSKGCGFSLSRLLPASIFQSYGTIQLVFNDVVDKQGYEVNIGGITSKELEVCTNNNNKLGLLQLIDSKGKLWDEKQVVLQ